MGRRLKTQPKCSKCAKTLDVVNIIAEGEIPEPKPGDITVCAYCATVLKFTDELDLRPVPDEEFEKLPLMQQAEILIIVNRIKEVMEELNRRSKVD